MDFLKAWVRASVLDISREKISEPAIIVKGVSSPRALAMPMLCDLEQLRDRSFSSAGLSADQDRASRHLALLDDLHYDTRGLSRLQLPD